MSRISLNFRGLMAPVFTPFRNDKARSLNLPVVDRYAKYLKSKGIHGVLVTGTTGEGPALNVSERKLIMESWMEAGQKYKSTVMAQIGGAPLPDVIELAKYAETLKIDAILCLPELYFKPKTVEELVGYLRHVAMYCKNTPLFYYHIPRNTGLDLNMPTFCALAEKTIPNFAGIKYTSGDLEQGSACLKDGRTVFLGSNTVLSAAMTLGFDSAILTTLSVCPEMSLEIVKRIKAGQLEEAKIAQDTLTSKVEQILRTGGGNWIQSMKKSFNDLKIDGVDVGPAREIFI